MARTPVTRVRTSHALTIKANGVTIGLINGWNPTQARTVTPIYELGTDDSGNPAEYMPGNITGLQVSVTRYDTYTSRMEEAFGTPDLVMLTRQNQPFDVIERWVLPDEGLVVDNLSLIAGGVKTNAQIASPFINEERFLYTGCWFSNLGRTLRSDDNRIVNTSATLVYTKKLKLTGIAGAAATFSLPF